MYLVQGVLREGGEEGGGELFLFFFKKMVLEHRASRQLLLPSGHHFLFSLRLLGVLLSGC